MKEGFLVEVGGGGVSVEDRSVEWRGGFLGGTGKVWEARGLPFSPLSQFSRVDEEMVGVFFSPCLLLSLSLSFSSTFTHLCEHTY